MERSAGTLKRVDLELGGKTPILIMDDADVDMAVAKLSGITYLNAGQVCFCPSRMLVHEKVHDEFAEKFSKAVS